MSPATNPTIEWVAPSRPFTTADLDRMPDDGHRYELIDGVLVVTPSPSIRHQDVVKNLLVLLDTACPARLRVTVAPFDVDLGPDTRVQPDLLVAPRSQYTAGALSGAPSWVDVERPYPVSLVPAELLK